MSTSDTTFVGRANGWVELFKNTLAALAILVGAIWAIFKFNAFDAPFLDATISTDLEVKIAPYSEDRSICIASVWLSFENVSGVSVDIKKVHLKMWFYEVPELDTAALQEPVLFDNFTAFDTDPAWHLLEEDQTPFLHKYDPNQSFSYSYRLAFHAPPNSNVIFRVRIEGDDDQEESLSETGRTVTRSLDNCS